MYSESNRQRPKPGTKNMDLSLGSKDLRLRGLKHNKTSYGRKGYKQVIL